MASMSATEADCPRRGLRRPSGEAGSSCRCQFDREQQVPPPLARTARSVPTIVLAILIAFFPKCSMCWAAYMSVLGSAWLAGIPYAGWIFPLLLVASALHLLLLWQNVRRHGWACLVLSVAGISCILVERNLFTGNRWLLVAGLLLMLTGSLLNNFLITRHPMPVTHTTAKRGQRCLQIQL